MDELKAMTRGAHMTAEKPKAAQTKQATTPNDIAKAIAMREAGYTAISISVELGISLRTLHRLFASHGAKKGSVKQALVEAARSAMIDRVISDETIRDEVAKQIADDLAHSRPLRQILAAASEKMVATNLTEAALVMRAAAAYSTALKNTSDTLRHTLRVDRPNVDPEGDLPELIITELSQEDVARLRAAQSSFAPLADVCDDDEVVELQ
jgi:hypothetical protein